MKLIEYILLLDLVGYFTIINNNFNMPFTDDQIREAVIKLFKKYDKDGTGYVEGPELKIMFTDLAAELEKKKQMSPQQINKILQGADLNQDGRISLDEMFLLMRKLNP